MITFCLQNEIEVVFLTQGGKFKGRLSGAASRSVELRRRQYEKAQNKDFCRQQARAVVSGKIRNQTAFIRRQADTAAVVP